MVILEGDRGAGKTSLVREFLAKHESEHLTMIKVNCSPLWGDGLSPFLEPLLRLHESSIPSQLKGALDLSLRQASENSGILATLINNLFHSKDAKVALPGLTDAIASQAALVYYAYSRLLEGVASGHPLVLWVEDLQWLDLEGWGLLAYLGDRLRSSKILILGTHRSSFVTNLREKASRESLASLKQTGTATWIELQGLTEREVGELVRRTRGLDHELPQKELHEVFRRTDGNPFFVNAVSTLAVLGEASQVSRGRAVGSSLVPDIVERVILDQLRAVYSELPEAKPILGAASVVGEQFEIDVLASVLRLARTTLRDRLELVQDRFEMIQEVVRSVMFAFRHSIFQEVVYRNLGVDARDIHRQVAEFLTREFPERHYQAYYHLRGAWLYGSARVQLGQAIDQAETLRLPSTVAALCEEYFEFGNLVDPSPDSHSGRVRLAYCQALYYLGRHREAVPVLRATLESEGFVGTPEEVDARRILGQCLFHSDSKSDHEAAVVELERALAKAEELKLWEKAGAVQILLSPAYDKVGRFGEATEAYKDGFRLLKRAIDAAPSKEASRLELVQADAARKACMVLDPVVSLDLMRGALAVFRRRGIRFEVGRCLNNIGTEMYYTGSFDEAASLLQEAFEALEPTSEYQVAFPLNNLGLVDILHGKYSEAAAKLRRALPLCKEESDSIYVNINLATADRLVGRPLEAEQRLRSIETAVHRYGEAYMLDHFCFNLGMTLADQGRLEEGLRSVESAPLHSFRDEGGLIRAKRLKFVSVISERLGDVTRANQSRIEASAAFTTTRPQKWYYEASYYPCELEFWGA